MKTRRGGPVAIFKPAPEETLPIGMAGTGPTPARSPSSDLGTRQGPAATGWVRLSSRLERETARNRRRRSHMIQSRNNISTQHMTYPSYELGRV